MSMTGPAWWPDLDALEPATAERVRRALRAGVQPRLRYTPVKATARQQAFVAYNGREAFYGGAAGGGKSYALLMSALAFVDVPGYSALILRRTLEELELPEALIDLAHQWLAPTDAAWNGNKHRWTFPSGATLTFGYLKNPGTERRYQSAAFQFIGLDEVTAFPEEQYTYLMARCRRPRKSPRGTSPDGVGISDVPLRVRSASNPGGDGHEWVKRRFVNPVTREAPFFPAKLTDNPHLDEAAYVEMMMLMSDPVTRARMMAGDWDVLVEGTRFRREWFEWVDAPPPNAKAVVRHWDLAATEPSPGAPDPDYTVGTRLHVYANGSYCVADVQRARVSSAKVETLVRRTAGEDGRAVKVGIEQEPGASGKSLVEHFQRNVLRGFVCEGVRPTGDKFTRAGPAAAAAEQKRVTVVRGAWNPAWLGELCLFTESYKGHDDQVDSFSGAFALVHRAARPTGRRARGALPPSFARAQVGA